VRLGTVIFDKGNPFIMAQAEKAFIEQVVRDVFEDSVRKASVVKRGAKLREAIDRMLENPETRKVYVVDDQEKLVGMVTTEVMLRLIGYRVGVRETGAVSFYRFLKDILKEDVEGVMVDAVKTTMDTKLVDALLMMLERHLNDLPVVDSEGRIIGELCSLDLFAKARYLFDE